MDGTSLYKEKERQTDRQTLTETGRGKYRDRDRQTGREKDMQRINNQLLGRGYSIGETGGEIRK